MPIWIFRNQQEDIAWAPSWFKIQIITIVVWALIGTGINHFIAGEITDALYRAPMAALRVGGVWFVFAIAASTPTDGNEFREVWKYLRLGVLVFMLTALLDYTRLVPMKLYFQAREDLHISATELTSLGYMSRNNFATVCVLGTVVLILALQLRIGSKLINVTSISIYLLLLLASGSRALFVGTCVMLCVPPLIHRGERTRNVILLVLGGITVMMVMSHVPAIAERFSTLRDVGGALKSGGRTPGWIAAIHYFLSNPFYIFAGVGYDRWATTVGLYCRLTNAHNTYLHILGEMGILFGTVYLLIGVRLGWQFFLMTRREDRETRNVATLGLALLIGLGVAGLADVVFVPWIVRMNSVYPLMIMLGLIYGRLRYLWAIEAAMTNDVSPAVYVYPEPSIPRGVLGAVGRS